MNGRAIHVLAHKTLAELTEVAGGVADADRRAKANRGDPKDYTFDPNPPKPSAPKTCPECGSKHQFGRLNPKRRSAFKRYHCGRCNNLFSYDKDWSRVV